MVVLPSSHLPKFQRLARDRSPPGLCLKSVEPAEPGTAQSGNLDGEGRNHLRSVANMANKTLGDEIRSARLQKGLGLRELARSIDLTPSYLSDIENDRRVPSEEVLKTLAGALDLDFDRLMGLAGRFGDEAERLLRRTPASGVLFRRLSQREDAEILVDRWLRDLDPAGEEGGRE